MEPNKQKIANIIIKNSWIVALMLVCLSCNKEDVPSPDNPQGYNMLLMGHSYFKPYANRIGELAIDAGFINHNQTYVFSSGASGFPISLWNDTGAKNQRIKETLDAGNVDVFGMVADSRELNESFEGTRNWIAYALQNNPEVIIFLSISSPNQPDGWEQTAQQSGFATVQEAFAAHTYQDVHIALIDSLRAVFPSTNIFSIPTGKASIALWQMHKDSLLLDNIEYIGPFETSLFTDTHGHQGEITAYTGALMWLKGIYKVDLTANDFDTGFNTYLHTVAEEAMNSQDPDYNQ